MIFQVIYQEDEELKSFEIEDDDLVGIMAKVNDEIEKRGIDPILATYERIA
ncbi:hypothetical protein BN3087_220027 [Sulfurovum sp. enrichment culture clone C5]|uniref:Uncharacterized protein n=1 Tax=Sulfurovum sp. enrichment culture clone C5 TaxID=497650 RepID=A0A0S4XLL9_9BACT|nr:hypothetical protein BN3087_220027 [Sulfurovum sp. enrichment culture clone C5]